MEGKIASTYSSVGVEVCSFDGLVKKFNITMVLDMFPFILFFDISLWNIGNMIIVICSNAN
jgi:hypothetical protein